MKKIVVLRLVGMVVFALLAGCSSGKKHGNFRVIAFYTAKNDPAHISFVHEANRWFDEKESTYHFTYDSTSDWNNMNGDFLSRYDVIVFLDTRPDSISHREAFEHFMKNGGGWLGFHFSAFALTPSAYPQNWDWYHNEFLGCGEYKGNTWRPTTAVLRVENNYHPVTHGIPVKFTSSANEWYSWQQDIRKNKNMDILLSIDTSSFPLGTGPKPHEIWHSGDYPVVWTNRNYRMVYINMGHNDIDYENGTNKELSFTFGNSSQDLLVLNALSWLGRRHR